MNCNDARSYMNSIKYTDKNIFVFYSSICGFKTKDHKFAIEHCGASSFVFSGFSGNSYAIPFVHRGRKLPEKMVNAYIHRFFQAAYNHPDLNFYLLGLDDNNDDFPLPYTKVAPLFKGVPNNCIVHNIWRHWMKDE